MNCPGLQAIYRKMQAGMKQKQRNNLLVRIQNELPGSSGPLPLNANRYENKNGETTIE